MYQNIRKKEIMKNTIYVIFILLLAVIPTYYIYKNFKSSRDINVNGASLDVVYHEKEGDKITLNKLRNGTIGFEEILDEIEPIF